MKGSGAEILVRSLSASFTVGCRVKEPFHPPCWSIGISGSAVCEWDGVIRFAFGQILTDRPTSTRRRDHCQCIVVVSTDDDWFWLIVDSFGILLSLHPRNVLSFSLFCSSCSVARSTGLIRLLLSISAMVGILLQLFNIVFDSFRMQYSFQRLTFHRVMCFVPLLQHTTLSCRDLD